MLRAAWPPQDQKLFAGQSGVLPHALFGAQYLFRAAHAQLGRSKNPSLLHALISWLKLRCQSPPPPAGAPAVPGGGGGGGTSMGCNEPCPPCKAPIRSPTSAIP